MDLLPSFIDKSEYQLKIWRYLDISKLESIFKENAIYFASAEQFSHNDLFEGAITEFEYEQRKLLSADIFESPDEVEKHLDSLQEAFEPLRRFAKISCWHINDKENMAMWLNYQGADKGVVIQSSPEKLSNTIGPYRIKPEYGVETIYAGKVKYINYEVDLMNERFGFLTPFFYKRSNYEYEKEFRMIISLRMASEYGVEIPDEGIFVPFDYRTGIEKVILSPHSDNSYVKIVEELFAKYNVELPIEKSYIAKQPRY